MERNDTPITPDAARTTNWVRPDQRALIAELDRRMPGWERRCAPRDTPDRRTA